MKNWQKPMEIEKRGPALKGRDDVREEHQLITEDDLRNRQTSVLIM